MNELKQRPTRGMAVIHGLQIFRPVILHYVIKNDLGILIYTMNTMYYISNSYEWKVGSVNTTYSACGFVVHTWDGSDSLSNTSYKIGHLKLK